MTEQGANWADRFAAYVIPLDGEEATADDYAAACEADPDPYDQDNDFAQDR